MHPLAATRARTIAVKEWIQANRVSCYVSKRTIGVNEHTKLIYTSSAKHKHTLHITASIHHVVIMNLLDATCRNERSESMSEPKQTVLSATYTNERSKTESESKKTGLAATHTNARLEPKNESKQNGLTAAYTSWRIESRIESPNRQGKRPRMRTDDRDKAQMAAEGINYPRRERTLRVHHNSWQPC